MEDPRTLYDRVLSAYAAEGFPADIIGQWAIPAPDGIDLVEWVRERRPKSVLEVGTFVGVSTMLIALASGRSTRIVTVDPNFPVAVEMNSMGSHLGPVNKGARTHDIAAAVARHLGVADQIEFLSGGFSSGSSFSSRRVSPDLTIPIIGPDVCQRLGPFDLAFIDGLHYADVVQSDATLASRHVSPDGAILLHDCIGLWGTNVRCGLSRFLVGQPEWALLHPPFGVLYRSIGILFRREVQRDLEARLLREPAVPAAIEYQLQALATSITLRLEPDHVIELVAGQPVFATKFDKEISVETILLHQDGLDGLHARLSELAEIGSHSVLVISAGGPDLLNSDRLGRLFRDIVQNHAVGVFLRTPPGETGSACIHSRPLRDWVRLAEAVGGRVGEMPPLDLAPSKFLFAKSTSVACSALCNLAVIISSHRKNSFERAASSQLMIMDQNRADILEQRDLLSVHYAAGFGWAFHEISEAQQQLQKSNQRNGELEKGLLLAEQDLEDLKRQNAVLDFKTSNAYAAVKSALVNSARKGHESPCLMLSESPHSAIIDDLLADPRIGSICVKDGATDDHLGDPRCGCYSDQEDWLLPSPCDPIYFIGPWNLLTALMMLQAKHADVQHLWVQVRFFWVRVSPERLLRHADLIRTVHRLITYVRNVVARLVSKVRKVKGLLRCAIARCVAKVLRATRPMIRFDEACAALVRNAQTNAEYVSGRVVLVCGNLSPGGAERQVANTLVGLAEAGVKDVALFAHNLSGGSGGNNFHLPRVLAAGASAREVERATTGINDPGIPECLRQVARSLPVDLVVDIADLVREFKRCRPEVVHAWLDWDNVRAGLAAAIAGVPKILLSGRNLNPSHFLLYQPYMDPAYRALASLPNVTFLNNSRAGADDYADWIGISRDEIKVIHNGVAFGDRRRPAFDAIGAARRKLGIADGHFVVGGVFRFEEEKQPLLWLDVAAQVRRAVPEAHFLLYGQGSLRTTMEAKICDLDLGGRVTLAGVTDDPLESMSLMDVFLLTSFGEGLPNVLLEAQWVGTPVVCTRAGGAPEAIDPGVSGWVVDLNSPEALAEAVVNIQRNPNLAATAALHGPLFVRQHFGISRMIAETVDAYGIRQPELGSSTVDIRGNEELWPTGAGE